MDVADRVENNVQTKPDMAMNVIFTQAVFPAGLLPAAGARR